MKSTSYGTGALCSSWCCHFKSCDVHLSICSVLFPATSPSSLPAPHCCQTKPWVPAQVPGSGSRFPLIRTHRGEKNPYFFSWLSFPAQVIVEAHSPCDVQWGSGVRAGEVALLWQGRAAQTHGSLNWCCFAIPAHSFSLGYLIRWTRQKAQRPVPECDSFKLNEMLSPHNGTTFSKGLQPLTPLNQDIYFHAFEPVGHKKKSTAFCVTSARQTNF